ncbi:queuosine 5'-phosphate N-glycosylase/hydrolase [Thermogemmatispora sp.]|uniref:queuosine 5'-phosphate N-glycosylase/hydrolase n=1 Tax=Thermogemmatispora sp. TaxID=1968838 RepID=UPI001D744843|nr:queuosine salvage family protein [Thermogemmatispora sp.]MBX5450529.1 queuosine salvage family protein [Thermogemmatispora sp.]
MDHWNQSLDQEEQLPPAGADPLGVLSSTRRVVEEGEHVWINHEQLQALSERWPELIGSALGPGAGAAPVLSTTSVLPAGYERYHFFDGSERSVNWILLLDALNFCFWPEKGQPRWSITYQGEHLSGYWAEAAALTRAVAEGRPVWDATYLRDMSREELALIFRSEDGVEIPLFEERLANVHEVGRVLLERFNGQFSQAIAQAGGSAVRLVQLLAEAFPSFRDVALYRQREVRFLKRAQICVADLHALFRGQSWGAFSDLEQLTIFADYKLPQVLRHFGVLEYHPSLAEQIDQQEPIPAGSEEEIEIRATTVWACELLRQALVARGLSLKAIEIDQQLWLLSQRLPNMRPYHRTRTIYY